MANRSFFTPLTAPAGAPRRVSLARLGAALEASWDPSTAYLGVFEAGNPALGQCYPTARVVQGFFPRFEIVSGEVETGSGVECHFWNVDPAADALVHVDLTWQQFGPGASVKGFRILDRESLGDSPPTVRRCQMLLERVLAELARKDGDDGSPAV